MIFQKSSTDQQGVSSKLLSHIRFSNKLQGVPRTFQTDLHCNPVCSPWWLATSTIDLSNMTCKVQKSVENMSCPFSVTQRYQRVIRMSGDKMAHNIKDWPIYPHIRHGLICMTIESHIGSNRWSQLLLWWEWLCFNILSGKLRILISAFCIKFYNDIVNEMFQSFGGQLLFRSEFLLHCWIAEGFPSIYLHLTFCNSPVWHIKFDELDFSTCCSL